MVRQQWNCGSEVEEGKTEPFLHDVAVLTVDDMRHRVELDVLESEHAEKARGSTEFLRHERIREPWIGQQRRIGQGLQKGHQGLLLVVAER